MLSLSTVRSPQPVQHFLADDLERFADFGRSLEHASSVKSAIGQEKAPALQTPLVPIPPGGRCIDVTGAQEAGPVVKAVLQKALALQQ